MHDSECEIRVRLGQVEFSSADPTSQVLHGLPVVPPPRAAQAKPSLQVQPTKSIYKGGRVEGLPGVKEDHIHEAFRQIDFDGNGFVGVSELRYLLTVQGERPTDEELDEMIRMIDTEGAGQISYEDFLQLFGPGHPVLLEMVACAPQLTGETTRRRLSIFKGNEHDVSNDKLRLMQSGVDAIKHALKKGQEHRKLHAGGPDPNPPPPLPVSRRQARMEMESLTNQAAAKGSKVVLSGYRRQPLSSEAEALLLAQRTAAKLLAANKMDKPAETKVAQKRRGRATMMAEKDDNTEATFGENADRAERKCETRGNFALKPYVKTFSCNE